MRESHPRTTGSDGGGHHAVPRSPVAGRRRRNPGTPGGGRRTRWQHRHRPRLQRNAAVAAIPPPARARSRGEPPCTAMIVSTMVTRARTGAAAPTPPGTARSARPPPHATAHHLADDRVEHDRPVPARRRLEQPSTNRSCRAGTSRTVGAEGRPRRARPHVHRVGPRRPGTSSPRTSAGPGPAPRRTGSSRPAPTPSPTPSPPGAVGERRTTSADREHRGSEQHDQQDDPEDHRDQGRDGRG